MTETWLSFATRRPGPPQKVGYGSLLATPLAEKEGEVKHSMEGTLAGALGVLDNLNINSSWPLSVPKVGPPLQHYPLEALTWHAGVKGDRRQDTSLIGNLTLIGEEHEDYPTNALNANQIHWSTEISKEVRRLCPLMAARPPTLRVNLWEHNWLSATSCPSGLIPWATIIEGLEEDDMTQDEFNAMFLEAVKRVPFPTQSQPGTQPPTSTPNVLAVFLDGFRRHGEDAAKHSAGGGDYTDADAVRAVKDKL